MINLVVANPCNEDPRRVRLGVEVDHDHRLNQDPPSTSTNSWIIWPLLGA